MIEILEKKIYFSGYGTSKYRCKWKYSLCPAGIDLKTGLPRAFALAMTDANGKDGGGMDCHARKLAIDEDRMQYELINMIDPANYGGYVVVNDSENGIFTGTVVIYYD